MDKKEDAKDTTVKTSKIRYEKQYTIQGMML